MKIQSNPDTYGTHFLLGIGFGELSENERNTFKTLKPIGALVNFDQFQESELESIGIRRYQRIQELVAREKIICATRIEQVPDFARTSGSTLADFLFKQRINLLIGPEITYAHSTPNSNIASACSSENALNLIQELAAAGIQCAPRFFPLATEVEQTDNQAICELNDKEFYQQAVQPFQSLILGGIKAIVPSHVQFPIIDTLYPASFSEEILTTVLRDRLQYQGIVICDHLENPSAQSLIEKPYGLGRALNAGNDVFIVAEKIENALSLSQRIFDSIQELKVSEDTLNRSHQRLDFFLRSLGLTGA